MDTKPTIDLISIGIVCEDGREYYAISKDFNLKEAWNRYQMKEWMANPIKQEFIKEYWIRDNVLKPIWKELHLKTYHNKGAIVNGCYISAEENRMFNEKILNELESTLFTYKNLKMLINKYGKTNKQIAEEIKEFIFKGQGQKIRFDSSIQFYGYYSDYDWVVFCWLFGKMIDLPKGFPKYCIDLKQTLDEKVISKKLEWGDNAKNFDMLTHIKTLPNHPKQTNEHSALSDAKWNKELYEFLNKL